MESFRRAVLVTGASSGIGRKTTELLAKNGFFVFAGARKDQDLDDLNMIPNVEAIRLDVTDESDVKEAVKTIEESGRGLYGLINNAGIVLAGSLIEMTSSNLELLFDVNVFGVVRVTKAFAHLIMKSKGRISATGSISGSACWELGGGYSMTKHALEAFTDTMALEMASFNVHVSLIEAGNFNSNLLKNMRQHFIDTGHTFDDSLFNHGMKFLLEPDARTNQEPDLVADAFLLALTDERPRRRYVVMPNSSEVELTISAVLRRVVQMSAENYDFDRSNLIRLLDQEIANGLK